ncbi:uncharacterized protein NDAI_0E02860 [Naumovozyma dairenensis CBS 421]|uniref:Uncharacterized protein n=1 Tax=Naumovozyma dairenensis (strain ATCC 10597 / BCRC 20456 / CBS 421 / NBRC 0211 / NRRL Y-12639) TaxID=1071378 RepID=G0WBI3_NAUDC|nr:hypothetical protein NDAI_0E02860 [Naumovozyma dairenensis CBS 421]CCD25103.1 hypothetical protein NDAI_0E02860 [Naumovozyma dairenensis CBS 421]
MQLRKRKRIDYGDTKATRIKKEDLTSSNENNTNNDESSKKKDKLMVAVVDTESCTKTSDSEITNTSIELETNKRIHKARHRARVRPVLNLNLDDEYVKKRSGEETGGWALSVASLLQRPPPHAPSKRNEGAEEEEEEDVTLIDISILQDCLTSLNAQLSKTPSPKQCQIVKLLPDTFTENMKQISIGLTELIGFEGHLGEFLNNEKENKGNKERKDKKTEHDEQPYKINPLLKERLITLAKGLKSVQRKPIAEDELDYEWERDLILKVALIHNIDISDLSDLRPIPSPMFNEVRSISKRLDKPLQKERNHLLTWPVKQLNKKKKNRTRDDTNGIFDDVPLYNQA